MPDAPGEITFVFTQDGLTEHCVAAASISGTELIARNAYNLSWVPIGKKLTITKAQGPIVYSIDGLSPYDIYVHYLGQEVADGLPLSAADFPLIIERDGIPMAIHATGVNEDGSFHYIHDFYPGEQLRFGFCHAGLLATGAQLTHEEVRSFNPQAIFIYSCVSRKWILGADIAVELSSLEDIAPSSGFFCYGEYFRHESGKTYFFSQTMTVLTLSEGDSDTEAVTENEYDPRLEESRQFRTMCVLHRLVDTSTREIESINRELAKLASKDSLTGLANRRLFDETFTREIKRQSRSGTPMSLLLVDIDFFKQFNDLYGHLHGDDCLRGISQLLAKVIKRPSDTVARYGGEEFACILPATNHENARKVAEDVRSGIEGLSLPHKGSEVSGHVTVSIGVLTLSGLAEVLPEELFNACDALLYKAKQNGRNRIEGAFFQKGSSGRICPWPSLSK
nr:diguanylate cyclase [uncultured Desulfobulbus sp.]